MGQGNAGVSRNPHSGRHPGHDLKWDAGRCDRRGLFPSPPEDERVAALESHDNHSPPGLLDEQAVDLRLPDTGLSAFFADKNDLGIGPGVSEKFLIGEIVVNHHVGQLKAPPPLEGQQPRIPGPGADEINSPRTGPGASDPTGIFPVRWHPPPA